LNLFWQGSYRLIFIASMALVLLLSLVDPAAQAAASTNFQEESFPFQSQEMTLEGTLFVPETPGKHPAVVLVHGSNSANREKYRGEAEMFAKAGIAALIYDKRADGFSKSRAGDRSYQLLSEDVNAAVDALRSRTELTKNRSDYRGSVKGLGLPRCPHPNRTVMSPFSLRSVPLESSPCSSNHGCL
jgi:poly(3-hydroxybutyrate) depolymerase